MLHINLHWSWSINRNILEYKGNSAKNVIIESIVLIETYWNVKYKIDNEGTQQKVVLIETYWNVKIFGLILHRLIR